MPTPSRPAPLLALAALALAGSASAATVTVSSEPQLRSAVAALSAGDTLLIADGTYTIADTLYVYAANVVIASQSGDRSKVVIQGDAMSATAAIGDVFWVSGDNVTIRDLTIQRCRWHLIQVTGENDSDGLTVRNCVLRDSYEQMIKGSVDQSNLSIASDNGLVEGCLFEYTAGIGPEYYIGGIDVHGGKNWIVRGNTFRDIISPDTSVAEFAVHFWDGTGGALVERNVIVDCDRGIGFGLQDSGNTGGIIRNNMIYHAANKGQFADVGIALADSPGSQVYGNSIWYDSSFPWTIEYRFAATTGVLIEDNCSNRPVLARDGATGTADHNLSNAVASWFVSPTTGNLHLASPISGVVDAGVAIAGFTTDFDGQARPQGAGVDIGADELVSGGDAPPTASLTSPANGASFTAPATITVSANAADSDGSIAKVEFYQGATLIGTDTSAPYSIAWSNVAAGSYALTVKAYDNLGATATSAAVNVTVTAASGGGAGTGLLGQYWTNHTGFVGAPTLVRIDPTVSFDWGSGSPASGISADHFTARWTGQVQPAASETYTFFVTCDDGARLWVNGQLLIDQWNAHPPTEYSGAIALTGGQKYSLRLEYFESGGGAVAKLAWSSPSTAKQVVPQARLFPAKGTGLAATYWDNQDFTGTTVSRTDATVDFDWGTGSPDPAIGPDTFSARWTGYLAPPSSGTWTFSTVSDDGVRLWVNGQLLIDRWTDHGATTDTAAIALTAGSLYPIRMDYYEHGGSAVAKLRWSFGGGTPTPVPLVAQTAAAGSPIPSDALFESSGSDAPSAAQEGAGSRCGLGAGIGLLAALLLLLRGRPQR